jgi:hypothetical protein
MLITRHDKTGWENNVWKRRDVGWSNEDLHDRVFTLLSLTMMVAMSIFGS